MMYESFEYNKPIGKYVKYLPRFIRRRLEEEHYLKNWRTQSEWFLPDKTVADAVVFRVSTGVWVDTCYGIGMLIRIFLEPSKESNSVDASQIIWSQKTIRLTSEAMWEAYEIDAEVARGVDVVNARKQMKKEIQQYFLSLEENPV